MRECLWKLSERIVAGRREREDCPADLQWHDRRMVPHGKRLPVSSYQKKSKSLPRMASSSTIYGTPQLKPNSGASSNSLKLFLS